MWRVAFFLLGFASGCSSRLDRDSASRLTRSEGDAIAHNAKRVVDAVYRFQNENGLWPNDLGELKSFDPSINWGDWIYWTNSKGTWTLTSARKFPFTAVRFRRTDDDLTEWELASDGMSSPLSVKYQKEKLAQIDSAEATQSVIKTMQRRIRENPNQIIHCKWYASYLYRNNRHQEAKDLCLQCLAKWPDHWWPNLMLSLNEAALGNGKEHERQFLEWVRKHDTFAHWMFAALFYKAMMSKDECKRSLLVAASKKLDDIDTGNPRNTGEIYSLSIHAIAYQAALMAYLMEDLTTCLAVCSTWEEKIKSRKHGPPGFLVFQAACRLRMRDWGVARERILLATLPPPPNYGYHFDPEILRLKDAILREDSSYRFDPRSSPEITPDDWGLFINYK